MFQSMQNRRKEDSTGSVNIAPLIDIMFILLIFFLVTTTFVRDMGIPVNKPEATYTQPLESRALRVNISARGAIYHRGQPVSLDELYRAMRKQVGHEPITGVVIVPDENAAAGRLVAVMDIARKAGIREIAVATKEKQ